MQWDAIGEILGATAVFASLIYLAIQIRSSSKTQPESQSAKFRSFLRENEVYRRYWETLYSSGLLREGLYEDIASAPKQ